MGERESVVDVLDASQLMVSREVEKAILLIKFLSARKDKVVMISKSQRD